jgi:hypothetical protein
MQDRQVIGIDPISCNHETSFKLTEDNIITAKPWRSFQVHSTMNATWGLPNGVQFSSINIYSVEKCNSGNGCLPNDILIESDLILRRSRMEP